jgi:UDP-N-acetyl-D-glucosamine dehydrogenase
VSTSIDALKSSIDRRAATVAVVGMGYVGLSLAVELARAGFRVHGIDLDPERVSLLNRGASYPSTGGEILAPLVREGRLTATTTFEAAYPMTS